MDFVGSLVGQKEGRDGKIVGLMGKEGVISELTQTMEWLKENARQYSEVSGWASGGLELARYYHPDQLCVKQVHGAMRVQTVWGEVVMVARNGMPLATPLHVAEFLPSGLLAIAKQIKEKQDREALVRVLRGRAQSECHEPMSCLELHHKSGYGRCLKGFDWDDSAKRATRRDSSIYCPNSRAGCTERVLFWWLPYALALRKKYTGEGGLLVTNVEVFNSSQSPTITYCLSKIERVECIEPNPELLRDVSEVLLATQTTPCTTCSKVLAWWHSNYSNQQLVVATASLSSYPINEVEVMHLVDTMDVGAIRQLMSNGVPLVWPGILEGAGPKLRT